MLLDPDEYVRRETRLAIGLSSSRLHSSATFLSMPFEYWPAGGSSLVGWLWVSLVKDLKQPASK